MALCQKMITGRGASGRNSFEGRLKLGRPACLLSKTPHNLNLSEAAILPIKLADVVP